MVLAKRISSLMSVYHTKLGMQINEVFRRNDL